MRSYIFLTLIFLMKILFLTIISVLAVWLGNFFVPQVKPAAATPNFDNIYVNGEFHYSLRIAPGYKVDNSVPELTLIKNGDDWLRINTGCFSSGVEDLKEVITQVAVNGVSAWKTEYYDGPNLELERIVLNRGNTCFALEMSAEKSIAWDELHQMAKTFMFTKSTAEE